MKKSKEKYLALIKDKCILVYFGFKKIAMKIWFIGWEDLFITCIIRAELVVISQNIGKQLSINCILSII